MTYGQSPKIATLMKQASTMCVDIYLEGGSGLGRECSESRGESMVYVNMGRSGDEGLCVGGSG